MTELEIKLKDDNITYWELDYELYTLPIRIDFFKKLGENDLVTELINKFNGYIERYNLGLKKIVV